MIINVLTLRHFARMAWGLCLLASLVHLGGCSEQVASESQSISHKVPAAPASSKDISTNAASSEGHVGGKALLSPGREELILQYARADERGDLEEAAGVLRRMILNDPNDYEAIFNFALNAAKQKQYGEAVQRMRDIPEDHPSLGISSLGLSADWCQFLKQYQEAEDRYRKILVLNPKMNSARRSLALLLNRQGRRHEAGRLIRELCLSGDITQAELQALIIESDAVCVPADFDSGSVDDPSHAIGVGGRARYLWTQAGYREVCEALRPLIESGKAIPAEIALYGAAAVEAQRDDWFHWWTGQVTEPVKEFPEYWSALGTHQLSKREFNAAVRALGEAIIRDPTDIRSTRRMVQAFRALNDLDSAKLWTKRFESLMAILNTNLKVNEGASTLPQDIELLANQLESSGRRLEGVVWRWIAAASRGDEKAVFAKLNQQRDALMHSNRCFPSTTESLCGLKLETYLLPKAEADAESMTYSSVARNAHASSTVTSQLGLPQFLEVASSVGVTHTYRIASENRNSVFAIYQTFGGAVALVDYDRDGQVDLYLAQGAADPPSFVASESDQLLRNITLQGDVKFRQSTEWAGVTERQYTIGVSAGDWNQDGFADVVVGNLGPDYLLVNQGDGTFRRAVLDGSDPVHRLDTSIAVGDVNGDHLPDIYMVRYLEDTRFTQLPQVNETGLAKEAVNPLSFAPALDQVFINDGGTGWHATEVGLEGKDESTGLGVIVGRILETASEGSSPRPNQVFIANDELANHFWTYDSKSQAFHNTAVTNGCAYSSLGSPTGSMGIAAADFDGSGTLDLHVTNFYRESSSHYLSENGSFRDLNVRYGIDRVSSALLGFGCQPIDCFNRGAFDIAVANGHVENLEHLNQPFRQPLQILLNRGESFEESAVDDPSGYCAASHLGRAMAAGDVNGDGKTDLVITGLMEPTAVLVNRADKAGHWFDLELIGTISERDGTGAKVTLRAGERTWTQWVKGGDGYLAKNESCLHFGIHASERLDSMTVDWSNGVIDEIDLRQQPVDHRYQLVQGESTLFQLERQ